jgi:hypothetical protein
MHRCLFILFVLALATLFPAPVSASQVADEIVLHLAGGWSLTTRARIHGPNAARLDAALARAGAQQAYALGGNAYLLKLVRPLDPRVLSARLSRRARCCVCRAKL